MARVKRKINTILVNSLKTWSILILVYALTIVAVGLLIYYKYYRGLYGLILVIPFLAYYTMRQKKQLHIFKAGREGERKTLDMLKLLPKECYVITNKQFTEQVVGEIDFIIITPTGVKVVESKNYSGTLIGKPDEREWTQRKTLRDKTIEKKVKNPLQQLKRQLKLVETVLYELDFDVPLEGCVYITHPYFKPTYTYDQIIHGDQELVTWLTKGKKILSKKQIKNIYRALK